MGQTTNALPQADNTPKEVPDFFVVKIGHFKNGAACFAHFGGFSISGMEETLQCEQMEYVQEESELQVFVKTFKDFGLNTAGPAHYDYDYLCRVVKQQGYELCPAEVAPALLGQLKDASREELNQLFGNPHDVPMLDLIVLSDPLVIDDGDGEADCVLVVSVSLPHDQIEFEDNPEWNTPGSQGYDWFELDYRSVRPGVLEDHFLLVTKAA